MKNAKRLSAGRRLGWLIAIVALISATNYLAQQGTSLPEPKVWTTAEDHQNMMQQLGIRKLRPGPSGNAPEGAPNAANYDTSKANPYPDLPEVLTLKNGRKVTTADMWWKERRPEIVEEFDREVLGRVPKNVPKVTWEVTNTVQAMVGNYPVVGKQLVGRVDNSSYPAIEVNIQMTLVTPADAKGPVPVMMMFGGAGLPGAGGRGGRGGAAAPGAPPADPPGTEQLIAAGWGYAGINPGSIQADSGGARGARGEERPREGGGLTRGIIGLVNKGQA